MVTQSEILFFFEKHCLNGERFSNLDVAQFFGIKRVLVNTKLVRLVDYGFLNVHDTKNHGELMLSDEAEANKTWNGHKMFFYSLAHHAAGESINASQS